MRESIAFGTEKKTRGEKNASRDAVLTWKQKQRDNAV
jgi:hypothetical protein